jgi:hypothetical protein
MMEKATRQAMPSAASVSLRNPSTGVWVALFAGTGALAVGAGDCMFEPAYAAASLAIGVSVSIFLRLGRGRGNANRADANRHGRRIRPLAVAVATGAVLGLLLFVACILAWGVVQVGLEGRTGLVPQYCLGILCGACFGLVVQWLGRKRSSVWRERLRIGAIAVILVALAIAGVLLFTMTGPADLDQYPPAAESPYKLPWKAGIRRLCSQSNRGISHRGSGQFAFDFPMPVGTDVCAARAGTVVHVEVSNDGNGFDAPGNHVIIAHGDGTFACYAHIKHQGSYVTVGQRVDQGQPIATSGNVGYSLSPHLHFHVSNGRGMTLPITFADVPGDGIPRLGLRYSSGNTGAP